MRNKFLLFLLLATQCVYTQTLVPLSKDSKVTFKIKNLGFNTNGSFEGIEGKIVFDPAKPSEGLMDVIIPAKTVNTGNDTRDNHLRKEDYFDVQNYPNIHFVSTRIAKADSGGSFIVTGKLTIKKTTREISFPFKVTSDNGAYRFLAEFSINRRNFKIGGNSTISDNLEVSLDVVTKKS